MALAAMAGVPPIPVGFAGRHGSPTVAALSSTTLDAANEAAIMIGHLFWLDSASHTVDTSGSSSLQWRSATTTFVDAGTTVKVGLAAVHTTAGPPARAAHASDVITFDVSASFTGSGITSAAWQTSVPTSGTKTVSHGELVAFAVQMTARGGSDSVLVSGEFSLQTTCRPTWTAFTGGSYLNSSILPNAVVVASDGTLGFFLGGFVASVGTATQSWNNTSGTKEYGNILKFPFPVRAYGIVVGNTFGGDCDLVLYSDPLGTPVAEKSVSVDLNTVGSSGTGTDGFFMFSSTYDLAANTNYAAIAKPTSATNVGMAYKTYNHVSHQGSDPLGTNCYAINRNTGAFAAQNSSLDRFTIGLLVGAFDAGGAAGGGISRARAASGF